MDEFTVDLARLAAEVGDVFAVAGEVDAAVSAGLAAQTMSQTAFGLLCVAMVPPSQTVQTAAVTALRAEAAAYEAVAMNLRNAVTDYEIADTASAARHRALRGRVG
ncbi:hypothetical protein KIN34_09600 [Cellulomonas sp. DKR-3]|uniref:ESX-1 secretion-associated protein n=1 Tax=Cellulomonas fulva TaxID=2835530 RepID=A0ABS5TZH3_9CELL|nr:type VII secretion target [Cellulomonas fulva]MBT0994539.1 hypothetical protein [Cellulomonas fulva]